MSNGAYGCRLRLSIPVEYVAKQKGFTEALITITINIIAIIQTIVVSIDGVKRCYDGMEAGDTLM